ncbi:MAG: SDR family oxidoreductase [Anaerolineales bacterium]|nr:SDR family oxidoreductase [Anaerolineales bacterium]MCX7756575.1 SDR family oxidoreductase [Anaerolineales bacterium]MDW8278625.1 SDR family oxidoreductase [Anaerolineales bacterium]
MPSWERKLVFVTGGSSGIGLEIARLAAAQGADVWLLARRPDVLEMALEQVRASSLRSEQRFGCLSVDLGHAEESLPSLTRLITEVGVPDVLVNAAGAAHPGYVEQLDPAIFRWMMDANYFSTVHAVKSVLPGMIARGSGHIINISSAAGFLGVFGYTAYGASKFAVAGFSEALRAEMKRYGIRVSIAYPADTRTPQLDYENRFKPPETKAISGTSAPQEAADVARAIVHQAQAGHYAIFTSFEMRLVYLLNKMLPQTWVFVLLDALAERQKSG